MKFHFRRAKTTELCIFLAVTAALSGLIFAALNFMHHFRQGSGCFFERGGQGWELIVSGVYGTLIAGVIASLSGIIFNITEKLKPNINFGAVLLACMSLLYLVTSHDQVFLDNFASDCGVPLSSFVIRKPIADLSLPQNSGAVVPANSELRFETKSGAIVVTAGNGTLRTIQWNGNRRSLEVRPYANGDRRGVTNARACESWPGSDWASCDGVYQCFYDECIVNMKDSDEFFRTLSEDDKYIPSTHTKTGLILGWCIDPHRHHTIDIIIKKVLIDGRIPTELKTPAGS